MIKKSKEELKWQAQSDADTMARYQEIISNKNRMSRAIKEAHKQAESLNKRATAMKNAASFSLKKKNTKS